MKFFDIEAQRDLLGNQFEEALNNVMSHGQFILGPEVEKLEKALVEYTGVPNCVTCASGTDALVIALMALGVGTGDEVIVPAFSYIATASAVALVGAQPIYCDVELNTSNIDATALEILVTPRTRAIIAVSLFGQCADFLPINRIAEKHQLAVIEDSAQSLGATYKNGKSCNLTTIACTSFFPTKPLGCFGDGGAVFVQDDHLAEKVRLIARHGQREKYFHEILGLNSRLDTMQAAILLAKLTVFDNEIAQRNLVANYYNNRLGTVAAVATPFVRPDSLSVYAQYTIRVPNRDRIARFLAEQGIPTAVHYPVPLNRQPAVQDETAIVPNSEVLCSEVLSLPMHAYLKHSEQDDVCDALIEALNGVPNRS